MWGQPPSAVWASDSSPAAGKLLRFPRWDEAKKIPRQSKLDAPSSLYNQQRCGALPRRTAEGGCPHTMPKAFYRRQLPHLQCDDKPHFVTFCTEQRWLLPECVRHVVLGCCLHDNCIKFDLKVAVVMPDHVHLIFTPLVDRDEAEIYSLAKIMDAVKGASAHKVNKVLGRRGRLWQAESFDHVLRSSENLDAKVGYVLDNPVRAGLVGTWSEYRWLWRKPVENPFGPSRR
jgi:putative transposase